MCKSVSCSLGYQYLQIVHNFLKSRPDRVDKLVTVRVPFEILSKPPDRVAVTASRKGFPRECFRFLTEVGSIGVSPLWFVKVLICVGLVCV